jgi:tight adherence protein B
MAEMNTAFLAAAPGLIIASAVLLGLVVYQDRRARRLDQRALRISLASASGAATPAGSGVLSLRKASQPLRLGHLADLAAALVPRPEMLSIVLARARVALSVGDFVAMSGALALAAAVVAWLLHSSLLVAAASSVLGIAAPALLVRSRIRGREARFLRGMPDAIDLVVRAIRSGLPVSEAIGTVAEEFDGPVSEIFGALDGQLRIGMDLNDALWTAARSMPLAEFRFLALSIAIQRETGGNLGEILRNLSATLRRRQQFQLKIKAMASEARASAMIIGSLPFIVAALVSFVNPNYIARLYADQRGILVLSCGIASLTLGFLTMKRLVKIVD